MIITVNVLNGVANNIRCNGNNNVMINYDNMMMTMHGNDKDTI